ncbi:hypothetical protein BKA93DRAFT_780228 [Sparassis latifolia]
MSPFVAHATLLTKLACVTRTQSWSLVPVCQQVNGHVKKITDSLLHFLHPRSPACTALSLLMYLHPTELLAVLLQQSC